MPDSGTTAASDSADASDDGRATFTIGDFVVTLEVPDGAAPAGIDIEISAADVPAEMAEIDDANVYAFDLEPSGLEFSEPATITFRFAALGDSGTPVGFVILKDSEGAATGLDAEVTRHADEVEISALVDHFSQALLVLPGGTEVELFPELLPMVVGQSDTSQVYSGSSRIPLGPHSEMSFSAGVLPAADGYISVKVGADPHGSVDVTCLEETDGVIENAYEAIWSLGKVSDWAAVFGTDGRWLVRLLGNVQCDPDQEGSYTDTESGSPPPTAGPEQEVLSPEKQVCAIAGIEAPSAEEIVLTFLGDCQEASKDWHDLSVSFEFHNGEWATSSDSGIQVQCGIRFFYTGEVLYNCDEFDREKKVSGSIDGVRFEDVVAGWTDANQMTFKVPGIAEVGGEFSGRVSLTETEGSPKEKESYP